MSLDTSLFKYIWFPRRVHWLHCWRCLLNADMYSHIMLDASTHWHYALCTMPYFRLFHLLGLCKNTLSLDCKTFVALQRLATRVKFSVTKPTEVPSDFWWQPGSRSVNVGELGAQNLDSSTFSHLNIQSVRGCLGQGPGQAAEVNRTTKSSVRLRVKSCWRWVDGGGGIVGRINKWEGKLVQDL